MGYIPGKKNELMEIDRLYESILSFSFKKNILKEGTLNITDISGTSTFKSKKLPTDKYFIIHHTAGRGNASNVIDVLNKRGLAVHWIIDRDANLYKSLPTGTKGAHVTSFYPSTPKDLNNSSTQGVEIIASNDDDILIPQCKTALKLVKSLGYPLSNIYGHGEVSSNKMKTEGATCKAYMKKYWDTPVSELPDSDTTIGNSVEKDNSKKDENSCPNYDCWSYFGKESFWDGNNKINNKTVPKITIKKSNNLFKITYKGPASGFLLKHGKGGKGDTIHQLLNVLTLELNDYLKYENLKPEIKSIKMDLVGNSLTIEVPLVDSGNTKYTIDRRGRLGPGAIDDSGLKKYENMDGYEESLITSGNLKEKFVTVINKKGTDTKDNKEKDDESEDKKEKDGDTNSFCQCMKNEKNVSGDFKFLESGKKCDPTKSNDEILKQAKDCFTDNAASFKSIDKLLGFILKEEKFSKNKDRINNIIKKIL